LFVLMRLGVISAEELLERAWDENADPFTNAEVACPVCLTGCLCCRCVGESPSRSPGAGLPGALPCMP